MHTDAYRRIPRAQRLQPFLIGNLETYPLTPTSTAFTSSLIKIAYVVDEYNFFCRARSVERNTHLLKQLFTMKFTAAATLAFVASASAFAPAPNANVSCVVCVGALIMLVFALRTTDVIWICRSRLRARCLDRTRRECELAVCHDWHEM